MATGPELSKSLTQAQALDALTLILNGQVDDVQSAVYLIALRMKRESEAEFKGSYTAAQNACSVAGVEVPHFLVLADPFGGFERSLPSSTFVPAVLAACGIPTVLQGAEIMGPKYGLTHYRVLKAAQLDVGLSVARVAAQVQEPSIAWAYLDQSVSCQKLNTLVPLRDKMVKRSVLTTIEPMLKPILNNGKTHLMTGFVHEPYINTYAMLAEHAGYDSALIVRGVEGGITPSLSQVSRFYQTHFNETLTTRVRLDPKQLEIFQKERAVQSELTINTNTDESLNSAAKFTWDLGQSALKGEPGLMRDGITYAAAIALYHLNVTQSLDDATVLARQKLDNGQASAHFLAAIHAV